PILDETASLVPGIAGRKAIKGKIRLWFRRMIGTCLLVEGGEQEALGLVQPPIAQAQGPFPLISEVVGQSTVLELYPREVYVPTWFEHVGQNMISTMAVPDNLIAAALPGDPAGMYSPFVQVNQVDVPAGYVQGAFTALSQIDPSLVTATGEY